MGRTIAALTALTLFAAPGALAQGYPERTVESVVAADENMDALYEYLIGEGR